MPAIPCGRVEQKWLACSRCKQPNCREPGWETELQKQPLNLLGEMATLQTPHSFMSQDVTGQWHFYLQLDQKKAYRHFLIKNNDDDLKSQKN